MKAYFTIRLLYSASILFLVVFLGSCATRYLGPNEKLVKKVTVTGIDKEFTTQSYLYIQGDIKPNPIFDLWLYNVFNTKKGKYRTDRIRSIGKAPNLLDSSLVEISRREIEKFLYDKSFFKAQVKSEIKIKDKRAYINFIATPGPSFKINEFKYSIADSAVKLIYEQNRATFSKITVGSRYDGDSLRNESKQINDLLKHKGYYDYVQQYVRFSLDSSLYASKVNVELLLENPKGQLYHKVYSFNNTSVLISKHTGKTDFVIPDTAQIDSQYTIIDYSKRFEPKAITRFIFLKKGDIYDIDKKNLTYNRLFNLNVFKDIKIDFEKTGADSTKLDAKIEATPLKRLSNRSEGEYTFNNTRSGFNIGNTYTNRNVFGGGEQLDLRIRYGLLFNRNIGDNIVDRIFNRDIQFGANLTFPRLLVPFNTARLGKNGIPHTTISSSVQIFNQLNNFRSRLYINSLTYDWIESLTKIHSFTPINIEYRNGQFNDDFKDSLIDRGYNFYVKTNDRRFFNLGSLYTYTKNTSKLLTYTNFLYFRTSNDFGGNTLNLLANVFNLPKNASGERTFGGLPYLRYVKTDIDLRFYKSLGGERQFVARVNPGIAIPFGNNKELPFEKNFFAGGSSGIRAWQARTLGPGNYNRDVLPNETTRTNLTNLDQLGEIKLESNLEYRFKIFNNFFGSKLKGAAFTDFGNIWRLRDETDNKEVGAFKWNNIFNQIAVGAGGGLRYDIEYVIFRLDVGFKVKDPQFQGSEQWVLKNLFNKSFKDEYYRTHSPESYRIVQYNFGIGLPF